MFDHSELTLACPNCGHQVQKSIGWLKRNDQFVCLGCRETVSLETDDLFRELKESARLVEEFIRDREF